MARKRDYKAEYARRQAKARSLGFKGYYERRTRPAPGAAKPSPSALPRLRGHASLRDFLAFLREGDVIVCDIASVTYNRASDHYGVIFKTVITFDRGEREFTIRNQTRVSLAALIEQEIAVGVIFSPSPSMDQRRLLSADESEGGY